MESNITTADINIAKNVLADAGDKAIIAVFSEPKL